MQKYKGVSFQMINSVFDLKGKSLFTSEYEFLLIILLFLKESDRQQYSMEAFPWSKYLLKWKQCWNSLQFTRCSGLLPNHSTPEVRTIRFYVRRNYRILDKICKPSCFICSNKVLSIFFIMCFLKEFTFFNNILTFTLPNTCYLQFATKGYSRFWTHVSTLFVNQKTKLKFFE